PAAGDRIIKRLYSDPISRKDQLASLLVPQRQREIAVEMADKIRTVLLIEMNDCFGVGLRSVAMSPLDQPRSEFFVVVDLSVECDPDRTVFVWHRRVAGRREIYNRQTPVSKPGAPVAAHICPRIVGTTVRHRVSHPVDQLIADRGTGRRVFVD